MVENVPVAAVGDSAERTLVLLTRPCPTAKIPQIAGRTYVQPSRAIPVNKFDYTWPDGLQDAYDLGRRDGDAFLARQ